MNSTLCSCPVVPPSIYRGIYVGLQCSQQIFPSLPFLVCVVPPVCVDGLPDPKETKPHMLEFHVQNGVGFAYKTGTFPCVDYC